MLKRLAFFPLVLVLSLNLNAKVSATAQWELRSTGNDLNGGFFNGAGTSPGTDFSQQDAPQLSFTDLASTNATTTCVVTSASHNFVAADNRNAIHISTGVSWVTGWYEIISVAANAATLDRACGSVASVTAGTWREGGGLLTPGGVATATTQGTAGAGGSNSSDPIGYVNVKAATYTVTTQTTINSTQKWVCYNTTHGDGLGTCTITTATNSIDLFHFNSAGNGPSVIFDNFVFTNTAVTPAKGLVCGGSPTNYLGIRNSSFSGFTNAIDCINSGNVALMSLFGVEIKNSTGAGLLVVGNTSCVGCWIHNNTGAGIQQNGSANVAQSLFLVNSIVSANGAKGITSSTSVVCINSDIANNTGDGVTLSSSGVFDAVSCVDYGNTGWGVSVTQGGTNPFPPPFNLGESTGFGSNTSGARQNTDVGLNEITLSANPFTSATNFALNSTAGGGAALATTGYPGSFPTGATVSTSSVGATQSSSGGGGGGGSGQIIYIK